MASFITSEITRGDLRGCTCADVSGSSSVRFIHNHYYFTLCSSLWNIGNYGCCFKGGDTSHVYELDIENTNLK